ncbi:hypothetical protein NGRA_1425 [Nosema granulosis]|uniref:FLYWCH-type domain-containing protein n=1 Tax=Nosema granulosis TaxID=83296 RepID=A0A9P6KYM4_9MICR|nr:hypothetical protein NGRA_1425 [Nosema granulosis]
MENNFIKIKSLRNCEKLIHMHYEYNLSSKNDATETWRCVERDCKGRVLLDLSKGTISIKKEHLHPPPPFFKVKRLIYNNQIIKFAETTEYSSSKIYDLVRTGLSELESLLVKKKNVHKLVGDKRKRQDSFNDSNIPLFFVFYPA